MGKVIARLEQATGKKCFDTFRRCLDGSRRTYKIADIPIGSQVFPIIHLDSPSLGV